MDGELTHHGILGMHWGVRRTPAELGHAPKGGKDSGFGNGGQKKDPNSKSSSGKGFKKVSEMSDEELRSRISRLNMEMQYKDLIARQNPKKKSVVKKLLGEALESLGRKSLGLAVDALVAKIDPKNKEDDFDINDFKDMDVYKMDKKTAEKVNSWYNTAKNIETSRRELRNPKEEKFDIDQYKDMDVFKMDKETIAQVSQWYENAQKIELNRQKVGKK